jgi:hypothetical protein
MALVIQFVVGFSDPAFHLTEHYYWMLLLAVIVTKRPRSVCLPTTCSRAAWRTQSGSGRRSRAEMNGGSRASSVTTVIPPDRALSPRKPTSI